MRGYSAITSQWIGADTIRRAMWAGTCKHLFGFRNTGFAAGAEKQDGI